MKLKLKYFALSSIESLGLANMGYLVGVGYSSAY